MNAVNTDITNALATIEERFRDQVRKDSLQNAYLLLHSDSGDFHVNLAAGTSGGGEVDPG